MNAFGALLSHSMATEVVTMVGCPLEEEIDSTWRRWVESFSSIRRSTFKAKPFWLNVEGMTTRSRAKTKVIALAISMVTGTEVLVSWWALHIGTNGWENSGENSCALRTGWREGTETDATWNLLLLCTIVKIAKNQNIIPKLRHDIVIPFYSPSKGFRRSASSPSCLVMGSPVTSCFRWKIPYSTICSSDISNQPLTCKGPSFSIWITTVGSEGLNLSE